MKNLQSFEEFVNESSLRINEAKKPVVTRTTDPKSMVAFNEAKGPFKVGMAIYKGKDDGASIVFPHLGDKGLNMVVAGPGFRAEWAKGLGISEDLYGQMDFNISEDELLTLAKKSGFKKARGNDYEKDARTPEEALKEMISFFKPLIDKLIK